jgi:hypothetical protein
VTEALCRDDVRLLEEHCRVVRYGQDRAEDGTEPAAGRYTRVWNNSEKGGLYVDCILDPVDLSPIAVSDVPADATYRECYPKERAQVRCGRICSGSSRSPACLPSFVCHLRAPRAPRTCTARQAWRRTRPRRRLRRPSSTQAPSPVLTAGGGP